MTHTLMYVIAQDSWPSWTVRLTWCKVSWLHMTCPLMAVLSDGTHKSWLGSELPFAPATCAVLHERLLVLLLSLTVMPCLVMLSRTLGIRVPRWEIAHIAGSAS